MIVEKSPQRPQTARCLTFRIFDRRECQNRVVWSRFGQNSSHLWDRSNTAPTWEAEASLLVCDLLWSPDGGVKLGSASSQRKTRLWIWKKQNTHSMSEKRHLKSFNFKWIMKNVKKVDSIWNVKNLKPKTGPKWKFPFLCFFFFPPSLSVFCWQFQTFQVFSAEPNVQIFGFWESSQIYFFVLLLFGFI